MILFRCGMTRMLYYFNLHRGSALKGNEGLELTNLEAARRVAARYFGSAVKNAGANLFGGDRWRMEVTNERGLILFTIYAATHDAPTVPIRPSTELKQVSS